MKKYYKYKDSGIEWIGEIPVQWDVKPGKAVFHYIKKLLKKSELDNKILYHYSIPSIQQYGVPLLENGSSIDSDKYLVEGNEILFSKLNPRKGTVTLTQTHDHISVCSTEFLVLKPKGDNLRYCYYYLSSDSFKALISSLVQSATKSHQRAIPDDIYKSYCLIPPHSEQIAIADFLDQKTSEIERLIEIKEKLVELYEESKTAIINQAVTKGIDPDVEMKDSGVEWLGEIPKHWEVKRIGSFGRFSKGKGISRAEITVEGVSAITYGDIYTKYNVKVDGIVSKISPSTALTSIQISQGDLLFTGSGETVEDIGKCVVYVGSEKAYAGGDIIIFKQDANNSLFLSYSLNSSSSVYQKASEAKGEIIVHTYASNLKDIVLPIPSLTVQNKIVEFIESETGKIDLLIEKTKKLIELMKEYKTALISEVVMGKIKVTE